MLHHLSIEKPSFPKLVPHFVSDREPISASGGRQYIPFSTDQIKRIEVRPKRLASSDSSERVHLRDKATNSKVPPQSNFWVRVNMQRELLCPRWGQMWRLDSQRAEHSTSVDNNVWDC